MIAAISQYYQFIPYFLSAAVLAAVLTPLVIRMAYRYQVLDMPAELRGGGDKTKAQRLHKQITPRAGGLAVIIPFVLLTLFFVDLLPEVQGLLWGILILSVVGFIDDKWDVPGRYQLLGQIAAAVIVVWMGVQIDVIRLPLVEDLLFNDWQAKALAFVWIMVVMNAMSFVGGTDALLEGVSFIIAIIILLVAVKFDGDTAVAMMAAIFAGGLLGFTPFNFNPAKIFSGLGHPIYGFIIAILAIFSGAKLATGLMIMALPLIDLLWVMTLRIRQHRTINPLRLLGISGRHHLHHRLLDLGLSVRQVAYVEYSVVGLLGIIALSTTGMEKMLALVVAVFLVFLGFVLVEILRKRKEIL